MAKDEKAPLEQLGIEDQKAAIDIGVMLVCLGTRLPTAGKQLYDFACGEFLRSYTLPNVAKYALRDVANQLMASNWEFTITKKGVRLITRYTRLESENGEVKNE